MIKLIKNHVIPRLTIFSKKAKIIIKIKYNLGFFRSFVDVISWSNLFLFYNYLFKSLLDY